MLFSQRPIAFHGFLDAGRFQNFSDDDLERLGAGDAVMAREAADLNGPGSSEIRDVVWIAATMTSIRRAVRFVSLSSDAKSMFRSSGPPSPT